MKYLIQAFACSPYKGGEYAVSWGWISHLDKYLKDGDILYVISLTLTEEEINKFNLNHVKLVPIDGLNKFKWLNYNFIFYRIWQYKAYKIVKNLDVDVIHIYSLSDYRQIGFWNNIKKAFKILGPVGGGQVTPKSLRSYDDSQGIMRELINHIYNIFSYQKLRLKQFDKIYACNYETQKVLMNSCILPDVPLNDMFRELDINRKNTSIVNIVFVGRLINKKGIIFLLDVLERVNKELSFNVHIFGDGDQKRIIQELIYKKGLEEFVFLKGLIPYSNISEVYANADIFVLPSLRESGGSVLVEAMAHKLPVVALKMALPQILNKYDCGIFIEPNQSRETIINDMVQAIEKLILDNELRNELGKNGYNLVNNLFTWEYMIREVYGDLLFKN